MLLALDEAVARDLSKATRLSHRKSLALLRERLAAGEAIRLITTGIVDRPQRPVFVLVALTDRRVLVAGAQMRVSFVRDVPYTQLIDVTSRRDFLKRGRPLVLDTGAASFEVQVTGRKDLDVHIGAAAGLNTAPRP
jgi:hypothetical protein